MLLMKYLLYGEFKVDYCFLRKVAEMIGLVDQCAIEKPMKS